MSRNIEARDLDPSQQVTHLIHDGRTFCCCLQMCSCYRLLLLLGSVILFSFAELVIHMSTPILLHLSVTHKLRYSPSRSIL